MGTALECPNGCGYVAKHQGALNLHKAWCDARKAKQENDLPGKNQGPGQNPGTQAGQGTGGSTSQCSHSWRMLNPYNQAEQRAMQMNYGEVCTKCQELR